MKISNKQKRGIEKLTGRPWDTWSHGVLGLYFAYTDKGIRQNVPPAFRAEYNLLMNLHHFQTVIIELWKEDFKSGLLFLDDFLSEDYPLPYLQYVVDTYVSAMGWIPSKYLSALKEKGMKGLEAR